ncbi:hypothetical protein [Microbacterium arabinogalactanolyticum]|uniref:hypothetical protein n=1 Tax=Microbacterium arabinogalactanolyticum TaxID=69365 RepID=UPI002556F244|nr:hypothetical protein [Microbacterium arabinogalactanolyticum]GLC84506.1 hypothetical protein MIAR_10940 [Microbacterium arabinogalactanolyticum]
MALRIVNTARLDELEHYVRRIEAERDDLKAQLARADAQFTDLQQQLWDAKRPVPTELAAVTTELRAFVPTLPQAQGFHLLQSATDAKAYAQAVHLLMQHARLVGYEEGHTR